MARTEIELIRDGKVVRSDLESSIIDTSKLDTDAVTTIKIKDKQVTPANWLDSVSNTFFLSGVLFYGTVQHQLYQQILDYAMVKTVFRFKR